MFLIRSFTANKPKPDPEFTLLFNFLVSKPFPLSVITTRTVSVSFVKFSIIKEASAYFMVFVTAS